MRNLWHPWFGVACFCLVLLANSAWYEPLSKQAIVHENLPPPSSSPRVCIPELNVRGKHIEEIQDWKVHLMHIHVIRWLHRETFAHSRREYHWSFAQPGFCAEKKRCHFWWFSPYFLCFEQKGQKEKSALNPGTRVSPVIVLSQFMQTDIDFSFGLLSLDSISFRKA